MSKSLHDIDTRGRTLSMSGEICPECSNELISMGRYLYCSEECGYGWTPMITWREWEDEIKPTITQPEAKQ